MQTQSKKEQIFVVALLSAVQGCTTNYPVFNSNKHNNSNEIKLGFISLQKHGANEDDTNFSLDENFSTLISLL